jgi:hypothetical protein
MTDIFFVLSAVGVDYGVYSYDQRIEQLKQTVNSIKKYKPDSFICLFDVSDKSISIDDEVYFSNTVNLFRNYCNHPFVTDILNKCTAEDPNRAARKTIGELIGTIEFLHLLKNSDTKFDRVFKLSGRLRLNNNFLLNDYNQYKNKIVTQKKWWYDRYAYLIQLWSFDYTQLDKLYEIFLEIWEYEMTILKSRAEVDIVETTLYRYLKRYNIEVAELDTKLGVEGNFGQDGAIVDV